MRNKHEKIYLQLEKKWPSCVGVKRPPTGTITLICAALLKYPQVVCNSAFCTQYLEDHSNKRPILSANVYSTPDWKIIHEIMRRSKTYVGSPIVASWDLTLTHLPQRQIRCKQCSGVNLSRPDRLTVVTGVPWWRHQMETFSALLALCAGNSPVSGEFPSQKSSNAELCYFSLICA